MLQGEELKLVSVALDGRALGAGDYQLDGKSLTIADVPDRFTLETVCEIAPAANTALEGLYQSNGMFCTQCEPEGFRRITWFLDRPDNLSVFTVRIEADKDAISGAALQRQPHRRRRSGRRAAFRALARSLSQAVLSVRAGGGRSGLHP